MVVGVDYNPKSIKPKNRWHKIDDIMILSG